MLMTGDEQACNEARALIPGITTTEVKMTMELECTTASTADKATRLPRSERVSGTVVRYQARDAREAYQAFCAMADLIELTHFISVLSCLFCRISLAILMLWLRFSFGYIALLRARGRSSLKVKIAARYFNI